MKTETIFNLFLLISALHGFFFCTVLLFSKDGKKKSMLYLNLLVLVISLNNFQSWLLAKHFFSEYIWVDYIHIPLHFLIAPFFYMFLVHYLKIAAQSKKLLHLLMPVFIGIILIRFAFLFSYRNAPYSETLFIFERYTSIEEIISLIVSLSVFMYSYFILSKKEKLFKNVLSFDNLQWIYTFFKLGAFTYVFWIVALAITVYLNFTDFIYSYYPLRVLTTVLIYWIGYQGIRRLKIIKERVIIRGSLASNVTIAKIPVSSLQKENSQEQFIEVDTYIKENNRFIDSNITLESLAEELEISPSTFSVLINNGANKTFPDYINELRVEQAKKLFSDKNYYNYTVISIGLESGFNSRSTFYTAFKKHTGIAPAAYKKGLYS